MKIVKNINGVEIELTAEEIAQKEAEEQEWADGANDRLAAKHREKRNALLAASDWTQANDSPLAIKIFNTISLVQVRELDLLMVYQMEFQVTGMFYM